MVCLVPASGVPSPASVRSQPSGDTASPTAVTSDPSHPISCRLVSVPSQVATRTRLAILSVMKAGLGMAVDCSNVTSTSRGIVVIQEAGWCESTETPDKSRPFRDGVPLTSSCVLLICPMKIEDLPERACTTESTRNGLTLVSAAALSCQRHSQTGAITK